VTSFHHQPEAQHPKSSAIHKLPADYPIFGLPVQPVDATAKSGHSALHRAYRRRVSANGKTASVTNA
jgi:hypothetical protein